MGSGASVVVVGGGIGGLAAAASLAARGLAVSVLERAPRLGGKMREIVVDRVAVDSGPTVLTLPDVFDELFAGAGGSFRDAVRLRPLDVLARHSWTGGATLDLFADLGRSADAIGDFAGPRERAGFLAFSDRARRIHATLDKPFMRAARPSLPELVRRVGPLRLGALAGISPFTTLWRALGEHFADPRLLQLFGRYATYCGSSPFEAPATLMLVAHVEQAGVWTVEGGMYQLVEALAALAQRNGAVVRVGAEVTGIDRAGGRMAVALGSGERIEADAVLVNGDVSAFGAGLFGRAAARAAPPIGPEDRSLSAVTYSMVAAATGPALARHNVFFSDDYPAEFDAIRQGRVPADPTVYVCAQSRGDPVPGGTAEAGQPPEPLFAIVNAPATGDGPTGDATEESRCEMRMIERLARCGLSVRSGPGSCVATTPADFARMFPATGGALYGRASHGWMASFQRQGSRTRIPGLYVAGGSTHPGPGVPMAALSGMLAASAIMEDLASTSRSRRTAISGGTSMR